MIKIAVVGTGKIAKELLPYLYEMPEVKLEVICSTKRSRQVAEDFAARFEIPYIYDDYEEMLAALPNHPVDAVYIATPNSLHYEMGKAALNAGQNIFMEKPFTSKLEDAVELINMAREKKLFLIEAISTMHLPIYKKMKEMLPLIGDVTYVDANFSQYSTRMDGFLAGEYYTVMDPEYDGGSIMDLGVYSLHSVAGLFGKPDTMNYVANYMNNGTLKRPVDVSGVLVAKYPGFIAMCTGCKDSQGPSRILVQGTKGYLEIQAPPHTLAGPLMYYNHADRSLTEVYRTGDEFRLCAEFRELDRMLNENDYDFNLEMQEESLAMCTMLEKCRQDMINATV